MSGMSPRAASLAVVFLAFAGCTYGVRSEVDRAVCDAAAQPLDLEPVLPAPPPPEPAPPIQGKGLAERLRIPPELPGARTPPIQLPPPDAPRAEREAAINNLYQPLPQPVGDLILQPGPEGRPLALADLERLAMTNNPALRQAAADVEAARGAAIQAGLPPNPSLGFEGDQMGSSGTAGQIGGFVEQVIKTAGKLKLARAAAEMDLANAEQAFRAAQNDVMSQVRSGYFAVLVARENVRAAKALARFTDEVYRVQVEQVRSGQLAAPYEPLQLRVLAVQARGALVQAQNRHAAAWKQLTAALGILGMPPRELAGRVDAPLPLFHYDQVLTTILARHTDVATARNSVLRARYNLRLAQITPVPDVDVRVAVQKDYTGSPVLTQVGVQVGVPVPVWDRNQGNIIQAQANLLRAVEQEHRVRTDLTSRLAEAFERYENARTLLDYYRLNILPDQVRAYRGVYERHNLEPDRVSFGDVITAQQTLATTITSYLVTLGSAWTAVVDVANLLQTPDLFQLGQEQCVAPVPELAPLPCCHPNCPAPACAPVPPMPAPTATDAARHHP
jgi:outer membrane protein, heavy metal efflux system